MEPWLIDTLACPFQGCRGPLAVVGGGQDGVLSCTECEAPYPVLGGIPVLTELPTSWLATYRESVLATLAETGLASPAAVSIIATFADPAGDTEPMRFGDDWLARDLELDWPSPPSGTDQAAELDAFLRNARDWGPTQVLPALLGGGPLGRVLELGCGAGLLTEVLRFGAEHYAILDVSLRALTHTLGNTQDDEPVPAAVVAEAECLPFADAGFDTLVAASLVDLLDDPHAFMAEAHRVLKVGGRLALTTPEPDLGSGDDNRLRELAEQAGFRLIREVDGVPWIRPHRSRFYQVYVVKALVFGRQ